MENKLAQYQTKGNVIESVVIGGDLSKLTAEQRVSYYQQVCTSIGLNPLTRPFDYITLNGKLTLYARKDAADQLRKINGVSIDDVEINEVGDSYFVKVKGHDSTGRSDVEIGVVNKKDMQGNIANVQMKAVTKAKRRLTLSICGLGWLDETEIETIPDARTVDVDDNGVIDAEPEPAVQERVSKSSSKVMSYEDACNVTGSDKKKYGNCTNEELERKRIGILKALKGDVDAVKQSQYQNKLEAIKVLLAVPEPERLKLAGQPELTDAVIETMGLDA